MPFISGVNSLLSWVIATCTVRLTAKSKNIFLPQESHWLNHYYKPVVRFAHWWVYWGCESVMSGHAAVDACDCSARCVCAPPQYYPAPAVSASPARRLEGLCQGPGCCMVFLVEAHGWRQSGPVPGTETSSRCSHTDTCQTAKGRMLCKICVITFYHYQTDRRVEENELLTAREKSMWHRLRANTVGASGCENKALNKLKMNCGECGHRYFVRGRCQESYLNLTIMT